MLKALKIWILLISFVFSFEVAAAPVAGVSSYYMFGPQFLRVGVEHIKSIAGSSLLTQETLEKLLFLQMTLDAGFLFSGFNRRELITLTKNHNPGIKFLHYDFFAPDMARVLFDFSLKDYVPPTSLRKGLTESIALDYYRDLRDQLFFQIEGMKQFTEKIARHVTFSQFGDTVEFDFDGSSITSFFKGERSKILDFLSEFGFLEEGALKLIESGKAPEVIKMILNHKYSQLPFRKMEATEREKEKNALYKKIIGDEDLTEEWLVTGIFIRILRNSIKFRELLVQQRLIAIHEAMYQIHRQLPFLINVQETPEVIENNLRLMSNLNTLLEVMIDTEKSETFTLTQLGAILRAFGEEEKIPSIEYGSLNRKSYAQYMAFFWGRFKKIRDSVNSLQIESPDMIQRAKILLARNYQLLTDFMRITCNETAMPVEEFEIVSPEELAGNADVIASIMNSYRKAEIDQNNIYIRTGAEGENSGRIEGNGNNGASNGAKGRY